MHSLRKSGSLFHSRILADFQPDLKVEKHFTVGLSTLVGLLDLRLFGSMQSILESQRKKKRIFLSA